MFTEISKLRAIYFHEKNEKKKRMVSELKNKEISEREKKAKEELEEKRRNWKRKKDELEKEMKLITAKKSNCK